MAAPLALSSSHGEVLLLPGPPKTAARGDTNEHGGRPDDGACRAHARRGPHVVRGRAASFALAGQIWGRIPDAFLLERQPQFQPVLPTAHHVAGEAGPKIRFIGCPHDEHDEEAHASTEGKILPSAPHNARGSSRALGAGKTCCTPPDHRTPPDIQTPQTPKPPDPRTTQRHTSSPCWCSTGWRNPSQRGRGRCQRWPSSCPSPEPGPRSRQQGWRGP